MRSILTTKTFSCQNLKLQLCMLLRGNTELVLLDEYHIPTADNSD